MRAGLVGKLGLEPGYLRRRPDWESERLGHRPDVEGEIRNGETVILSVSRNGQPANTVLQIEGAERERHETGSDGEVAVEVTGAEVFEVEVQRLDAA